MDAYYQKQKVLLVNMKLKGTALQWRKKLKNYQDWQGKPRFTIRIDEGEAGRDFSQVLNCA